MEEIHIKLFLKTIKREMFDAEKCLDIIIYCLIKKYENYNNIISLNNM